MCSSMYITTIEQSLEKFCRQVCLGVKFLAKINSVSRRKISFIKINKNEIHLMELTKFKRVEKGK